MFKKKFDILTVTQSNSVIQKIKFSNKFQKTLIQNRNATIKFWINEDKFDFERICIGLFHTIHWKNSRWNTDNVSYCQCFWIYCHFNLTIYCQNTLKFTAVMCKNTATVNRCQNNLKFKHLQGIKLLIRHGSFKLFTFVHFLQFYALFFFFAQLVLFDKITPNWVHKFMWFYFENKSLQLLLFFVCLAIQMIANY